MKNNKKKGAKMFSKELGAKLDKYHLLKHPFYQIYWNEGKLTREIIKDYACLLYTSPSPRDLSTSRMPSSA